MNQVEMLPQTLPLVPMGPIVGTISPGGSSSVQQNATLSSASGTSGLLKSELSLGMYDAVLYRLQGLVFTKPASPVTSLRSMV